MPFTGAVERREHVTEGSVRGAIDGVINQMDEALRVRKVPASENLIPPTRVSRSPIF